MKINVELDLSTLGLDIDEDGNATATSDLIGGVAHVIAHKLDDYSMRSLIESEVRNVAAEAARTLVAEVLSEPIQPTNNYGEPQGAPTTLRALVQAEVDKWMRLPRSDSYSRNQTMGEVLEKLVDETLRKEMKPTIDAAKKALMDRVVKLAVEGAAAALSSASVVTR